MRFRMAVIVPTYVAMFVGCYSASFLLRWDFVFVPEIARLFWSTIVTVVCVKLLACLLTGEWQRSYRYATFPDVFHVVGSATVAAAALFVANYFLWIGPLPRSVILIDWALTIPCSGLVRVAARVYTDVIRCRLQRGGEQMRLRTLIVGTDREAVEILRTIRATDRDYRVVGLVDETARNRRTLIGGVPTCPLDSGWGKLVAQLRAEMVLIPSSVAGERVRKIVAESRRHHFKTHVIPTVEEIVGGRYKLSVRDVTITDLLKREPARLDMDRIREFVADRRILVTGAAGSIGSELCRQILRLKPAQLVLLDRAELGMFHMTQELEGTIAAGTSVRFAVADVADPAALRRAMTEHKPQTVFHAAAYKHVPLMEDNVRAAVRNNVLGTRNVVECAAENGVERFVLISTDKAVQPTSVMGATKFLAEKCVQVLASESRMRCITVRFGNVLNSAGSVVPTFRRQIESGGPLTVTHPEIERYFMTIPEAVQLVLQASAVGSSGDLLVLEMGRPCRILDLAKDMIALSGLRYPDDIEIIFTGLRPGEKLTEELFYESEECSRKVHEKIFCANRDVPAAAVVRRQLAELTASLDQSDAECAGKLWSIVEEHVRENERPILSLRRAA
ncbi:MAG: polysaccharide biosynthesis protein [Planctomycetaceae bacterium]